MEEDLPQICLFLFDIDFKVIDINFFKNPLPNDEVLSIIQKAKTQSEEKNQEIEKEIKTKVEAEKKIYTDDRLVTDKEIIERVFQKIHEITNLAQGEIEGKELKYIKEMEDELKKLKL
jgi:hypothetical protein